MKPRKLWLEVGGETPEDGELGLELGVGMVGGQDVRLCWEKNGLGIGECEWRCWGGARAYNALGACLQA